MKKSLMKNLNGGFLYKKERKPNCTKIKILGVTVWQKRKRSLRTEKFFLGIRYHTNQNHQILKRLAYIENQLQQDALSVDNTLSLTNEKNIQSTHQILERLACVENQLQQDVLFVNRTLAAAHANAIQDTHHKTFSKYKNYHQGKDVVLIATGPTLSFFAPMSDCVYVGINKAVMYDKVHLDYIFFQDAAYPRNEYKEAVNNYPNAKKFYGILQDCIQTEWILSESDAIKANAERYYVISQWKYPPVHFTYDIENEPLGCNGTVSYAAMQFILWTNPRRIYLVGQDCTTSYWDKSTSILTSNQSTLWQAGWSEMAKFAKTYYPETEIISVNPVGLKGLFHDVYTESYLAEHPEIAAENPEILKEV